MDIWEPQLITWFSGFVGNNVGMKIEGKMYSLGKLPLLAMTYWKAQHFFWNFENFLTISAIHLLWQRIEFNTLYFSLCSWMPAVVMVYICQGLRSTFKMSHSFRSTAGYLALVTASWITTFYYISLMVLKLLWISSILEATWRYSIAQIE